MKIDGNTRIYCLIADPIKHVRVPELYNAKFQERGFNVAVVPVQIRNTELPHLIEMARAWRNL
ncbi:MAG: shikimate dehydrogenase family protein, partial [Alphaproteobacteria bacterium]